MKCIEMLTYDSKNCRRGHRMQKHDQAGVGLHRQFVVEISEKQGKASSAEATEARVPVSDTAGKERLSSGREGAQRQTCGKYTGIIVLLACSK